MSREGMDKMNYLELFSSSCREKPRLMALAQALLRQVTDLAACAAAIEPGYAAENAVGVQLDTGGEMIGIPRPEGMSDADFRELIRAVRTFAEAMLAYIGTGAVVLGDVNWLAALSAGGFGFVSAILLALAGLPEAEKEKDGAGIGNG